MHGPIIYIFLTNRTNSLENISCRSGIPGFPDHHINLDCLEHQRKLCIECGYLQVCGGKFGFETKNPSENGDGSSKTVKCDILKISEMKRMVKNETDEVKKIVQQAKIQMNTTSAKMVSDITNMMNTAELLIETEESQIISQINKNPRLVDGKSTRIDIKTVPALIQIRSIYKIFRTT